jgi:serine-type D-Ala-D-Ala endopeptidase (penicillin-binding protein 7)
MMSFRSALLPSFVLGLVLAITPIHQAEAKETHTTKVSKTAKPSKTTKATVSKTNDAKKSTKKTVKATQKSNKKTVVAKTSTKTSKSKTVAVVSKKDKASKSQKNVVKSDAKKISKTKEQRLAERKERSRERFAKVSRTGQVAKVAKYTAKPVVVASVAASSAAVIASQSAPAIEQNKSINSTLNLESKAALVINSATGEVLYGKNTDQPVPIASITKLMTVMVVLDAKLPLDEAITITEDDIDRMRNTSSRLRVGSVLSRAELMLLALMSSENRAAHALARTYTGGESAAIAAMNRKANALGMTQTRFEDGTGLNSHNVASPKDLVAMVKTANTYPLIRRFSTTGGHAVAIKDSIQQFNNTNMLVKNPDWEIGVSKTGYINEAGKCLVMQAKIKSTPVVIVLMDSWGKYTRIGDAQRVKKWLESSSIN